MKKFNIKTILTSKWPILSVTCFYTIMFYDFINRYLLQVQNSFSPLLFIFAFLFKKTTVFKTRVSQTRGNYYYF